MPTYEYRCTACGHEFELFQSMSDSVKRKCPACAKPALERLIGAGAAVLFKGSGFYQTDYRTESYKKAAEAEKKPADEKKSGEKGGKASESKPAKSEPAKKDSTSAGSPGKKD